MNTTKQSILFIFFAIFAFFSTIQPAAAVDAGNVLCGIFLSLLAVFAIFTFIGWYSKRGQSSSSPEDEVE